MDSLEDNIWGAVRQRRGVRRDEVSLTPGGPDNGSSDGRPREEQLGVEKGGTIEEYMTPDICNFPTTLDVVHAMKVSLAESGQ